MVLCITKDIITENNTFRINLYSISTDFEEALANNIKNIFKGISHTGCLFHYIKNIRLNMNRIGLFKRNIFNIILKELGAIPFNFHFNNNIINEIFDKFNNIYSDESDNIKYVNFRDYFIKTWKKIFYQRLFKLYLFK